MLVTADAIEGFDHVDIWMRHGAIPTVLDHLVHTVLKKNGTRPVYPNLQALNPES